MSSDQSSEQLASMVISIIKPFRRLDYNEPITPATKLTDLYGQNQWNTLGRLVIRARVEDCFRLSVSEAEICAAETVGDLVKLVEREETLKAASASPDPYRFLTGMETC